MMELLGSAPLELEAGETGRVVMVMGSARALTRCVISGAAPGLEVLAFLIGTQPALPEPYVYAGQHVALTLCNGSSSRLELEVELYGEERCARCRGYGVEGPCAECGGTGVHIVDEPLEPSGRLEVACEWCQRAGYIACGACGGHS